LILKGIDENNDFKMQYKISKKRRTKGEKWHFYNSFELKDIWKLIKLNYLFINEKTIVTLQFVGLQ